MVQDWYRLESLYYISKLIWEHLLSTEAVSCSKLGCSCLSLHHSYIFWQRLHYWTAYISLCSLSSDQSTRQVWKQAGPSRWCPILLNTSDYMGGEQHSWDQQQCRIIQPKRVSCSFKYEIFMTVSSGVPFKGKWGFSLTFSWKWTKPVCIWIMWRKLKTTAKNCKFSFNLFYLYRHVYGLMQPCFQRVLRFFFFLL